MSFLDPAGRWPLVVLSLSFLPYEMHREVGEAVCEAARHLGRRVAFVASGDMSHRLKNEGPYSFSPFGPQLDAAIRDLVETGDLEASPASTTSSSRGAASAGCDRSSRWAGSRATARSHPGALVRGPVGRRAT